MPEFVPAAQSGSIRMLWGGATIIDRTWNHVLRDPFWRLYRNDRPGASLGWAGGQLALPPGGVVLIPAWSSVRGRCATATGHLFVHFAPAQPPAIDAPRLVPADPALAALAAQVAERADGSPAWWLRAGALVALALAACDGIAADPAGEDDRLRPALSAIEAGLAGPLPVAALARRCRLGADRFARLFRSRLGVAPAAWVRQRRIVAACALLRTGDAAIEEVASACGFANRHHFSRLFSAAMGCGPAAYRRSGRG